MRYLKQSTQKTFVNRDTNKYLSFQLTSISGNLPILKEKKIIIYP